MHISISAASFRGALRVARAGFTGVARTCLTDVYRNDAGNVVRMTYHGIHTIEQLADNNTFPAALQWQIGNHEPIEVSTVRLVDLSSTAIEQLVATKETLTIFD